MYHVTNQKICNPQPTWNFVRLCKPNDVDYDGQLYGLPVACFTTTLRDGSFPIVSPYPRNAAIKTSHWRVSVPFDPAKYTIFKVKNGVPIQQHLLCLRNDEASPLEIFLKAVLPLSFTVESAETGYNECFPRGSIGCEANEYSRGRKIFVNVHFIHPVPISDDAHAEWDRAQKKGSYDAGLPLRGTVAKLLKEWIKEQISSLADLRICAWLDQLLDVLIEHQRDVDPDMFHDENHD